MATDLGSLKPGDWVDVNGRRGVLVRPPCVVVAFEDRVCGLVPLGAVARTAIEPRNLTAADIENARQFWPMPEAI